MGTAAVIGLFVSIATMIVSAYNSSSTISAQKQEAEKARQFSHDERVEQNEFEQQMLEFNALNLPQLQVQGLENAGMSTAGALQAVAGGSGAAITPTASNAPGIQAQLPQPNSTSDAFTSLNDIFDNLLKQQQVEESKSNVEKNKTDVILTRQMVDESKARMDKLANDMHIDNESLNLAKMITDAQVNLYGSEAELNRKRLDEVDHHIKVMMAQVDNLDAQTIAAYAQASLYRAETTYYDASAAVQSASVNLVNAQVEGQYIANLDARIVASLKQYRLEVSEALGVDVDSDLATQLIEAMVAGRYDTVGKLIDALDMTATGGAVDNAVQRLRRINLFNQYTDDRKQYKYNTGFSPSFRSFWN